MGCDGCQAAARWQCCHLALGKGWRGSDRWLRQKVTPWPGYILVGVLEANLLLDGVNRAFVVQCCVLVAIPFRGAVFQGDICFSRKHGEGFFRWVHLSCSHESHYKVSLQGIIIMESLQGVIARSHCKESLQGVIARSHCKESLQRVIARSHCKESLQGVMRVIARSHCKESSASCKCKESSASKESGTSCKCMESSASCKCKEPSASCKCKESSAIDLRGVKISS